MPPWVNSSPYPPPFTLCDATWVPFNEPTLDDPSQIATTKSMLPSEVPRPAPSPANRRPTLCVRRTGGNHSQMRSWATAASMVAGSLRPFRQVPAGRSSLKIRSPARWQACSPPIPRSLNEPGFSRRPPVVTRRKGPPVGPQRPAGNGRSHRLHACASPEPEGRCLSGPW